MKAEFSPKRGRPSIQQVAAIDEAILSTARRIFFSEGFDALAMDSVAAELGISKGTLYSRHSSKEALLCAVIKQTIANWSAASAETDYLLPVELGARLREHLCRVGIASIQPEALILNGLWLSTRERIPELSALFQEIGYNRMRELLSNDIREAAQRDGIPVRHPEAVADVLNSALHGWLFTQQSVGDVSSEQVVAFVDCLVRLIMPSRPSW